MEWKFRDVSGSRFPRQFEYHPTKQGLIFGTTSGELCAVDTYVEEHTEEDIVDVQKQNQRVKSLGCFGKGDNDSILGLCWLRPHQTNSDASVNLFDSGVNNSNLFIAGSSKGRVVLGDASRPYDRENPEDYSVVHDYPTFERLTSVHVNSTNRLLLLSGYSNGVNLVDLETGQETRKFRDIHTDHINIARFSYMSPHLFATSSFDRTIKTWDLRQSNGMETVDPNVHTSKGPIYTVKCNSGVVMINFSNDDTFILASALDNEINQYMFLDGRKHLTYNLPKTGLRGNFTRAYYSSSGRYTVTGACEESTVKILCTYTGEPLANIDLYPERKDKSLYIQSLRGCPTDDDQLCVLTNYRDLQNRELVMVTRASKGLGSARDAAQEQLLPAPPPLQVQVQLQDPAVSVTHWFSVKEAGSSPQAGDENASANPSHDLVQVPTSPNEKLLQMEVDAQEGKDDEDSAAEELYNNSLMCSYSTQYVQEMRSLHRTATGLIHSYSLSAPHTADDPTTDVTCATDSKSKNKRAAADAVHISIEASAAVAVDALNSSSEVSYSVDLSDIVLLVHNNSCSNCGKKSIPASSCDGDDEGPQLFLLPVHSFVLKARCPVLYNLCLQQRDAANAVSTTGMVTERAESTQSVYFTASLRTDAAHTLPMPVLDISDRRHALSAARCSDGLPAHLLHLLPLVVDFLYTGNRSLDLATMRFYCLQQLLLDREVLSRRHGGGGEGGGGRGGQVDRRSIAKVLNPLVGDFLRAEIADYLTNSAGRNVSSFDSDQDPDGCYKLSALFWPVREAQEVELLMKICIDDTCWRQDTTLCHAVVETLTELLELSDVLRLTTLKGIASALLGQSICPNNALLIRSTSERFSCYKLSEVTLRFIAAHRDILRDSIRDLDMEASESASLLMVTGDRNANSDGADSLLLVEKLDELSAQHSATVVSRKDFLSRKGTRADSAEGASRAGERAGQVPVATHTHSVTHTAPPNTTSSNELAQDRSIILGNDELWLNEESPFLPAAEGDGLGNAVCLSRYISTTANYMLDDSVIFLGGQNLDRMHSLSNRVLTFNYRTNEFKHVSCGGTFVPKSGYMMSTASLQKHRPTHLIALGGRLKKQEVSVTHTNLPQHLLSMDSTTVLTTADPSSGTDGSSTSSDLCIEDSGATSIVHNKLIDVWNLTADKEELSAPSAQAEAARAEAVLSDFNKDAPLSESEDGPKKGTQAPDLLKKMGLIFELDYRTLTWRSPAVELVSKTQLSSYNRHNMSVRLLRENELDQLRVALACRVCPAVSALFHEDVHYRCAGCLFSTDPALPCNCSLSAAESRPRNTWLLQFSGYCNSTETIMADLHVLACKPKPPLPCWISPDTLGDHSSDMTAEEEYTYEWIKVHPSGVQPAGRFSHSSTVIPTRSDAPPSPTTSDVGKHSHTRILYFGGLGYIPDLPALLSLRINRSSPQSAKGRNSHFSAASPEFSHYAHWEEVQVADGPAPSCRQGHSLHYLPEADLCILYGGTTAGNQVRSICCQDMWLLKIDQVVPAESATAAANGDTVLRVHWERLVPSGVAPSIRARHVSFLAPPKESYTYENSASNLQGVLFVFGGVNEAKLQQRQQRQEDLKLDFDDEQKDSIVYPLHLRSVPQQGNAPLRTSASRSHAAAWHSALRKCDERGIFSVHKAYSRLLYFAQDILVQAPACSLSRDMLTLLDKIFTAPAAASAGCGMHEDVSPEGPQDVDTLARLQKIRKEYFARCGVALPSSSPAETEGSSAAALTSPLLIDITNGPETSTSEVFGSLLCKRCAWFRTLLTGAMKEAQLQRIELVDTDPVAYRLLLLYLYGDAVMITGLHDMVSLLELANKLDLGSLAKRCEGVLVRLITLDNVCELLDYSDTLNLDVLKAASIATILRETTEGDAVRAREGAKRLVDLMFEEPFEQEVLVDTAAATADEGSNFKREDEVGVAHREMVAAFKQLHRELRTEVWLKYKEAGQVFKV